MGDHSRLAPSDSNAWSVCTKKAELMDGVPPRPDTEASAEGTRAHDVAEKLWGCGTIDDDVSEEMAGFAREYCDHLEALLEPNGKVNLEDRVTMPDIHSTVFGTVDGWAYSEERNHLVLMEYKYGRKGVEVYQNKQMTCYASGLISRILSESDGKRPDLTMRVTFHVFQPRRIDWEKALTTWETTATELRPLVNILSSAASDVDTERAKLVPGGHCSNCEAAHRCDALCNVSGAIGAFASTATPLDPSDADIGTELAFLDSALALLELRRSALQAQGEARLESGGIIPGYHMKRGRGRILWEEGKAQDAIDTAELFGIELTTSGIKTPAQAKKEGLSKSIIDSLTRYQPGKSKIAKAPIDQVKRIFET